jgi:hypothetical protein
MTTEQYLLMCEQMGWEPNENEMPNTANTFFMISFFFGMERVSGAS